MVYPQNITFLNFWKYLAYPVFCYEISYPVTTKSPSLKYLLNKFLLLGMALMIIHIVFKERWVPIIEALKDGNQYQLFTALYLPGMTVYYMSFFIIFEIMSNIYAELTGFQDRQFYQDFWNSTNFDEYAKKWNKLVHEFLYRHYYLEYLLGYDMT